MAKEKKGIAVFAVRKSQSRLGYFIMIHIAVIAGQ